MKDENLKKSEGAYVDSLMEKSAAAEAGILKGDVITGIDDAPVIKSSDLLEQVGRHRPGDEVAVNSGPEWQGNDLPGKTCRSERRTKAGFQRGRWTSSIFWEPHFEELDDDTAKKLGIEGGVRIKELGNGLLKNQTSISEGFIITGINHEEGCHGERYSQIPEAGKRRSPDPGNL